MLTDTTRVELGYSTYIHQSTISHMCKERASACRTSTELSMDLCVICTRMNTHLYVHVCSVHKPIVERPKVKLNAYICMYMVVVWRACRGGACSKPAILEYNHT